MRRPLLLAPLLVAVFLAMSATVARAQGPREVVFESFLLPG